MASPSNMLMLLVFISVVVGSCGSYVEYERDQILSVYSGKKAGGGLSESVAIQGYFGNAAQLGFTVDLIHRDSPQSPWFNSSATRWTVLRDTIQRSISRSKHFKFGQYQNSFGVPVLPASGEFLMEISIGTPPSLFVGIVDTGSDLIWTQCKPCSCYQQTIPVFDPSLSSSYKPMDCGTRPCRHLGSNYAGCSSRNTCMYTCQYGDQSSTMGDLAMETFTFGARQSIQNVVFGCGRQNQGTFRSQGSGLIGLGGGTMSLVSQMGTSIDGKLAYCLVPFQETNSTGKIMFGTNAVMSGPGVVSTPFLRGNPVTFYYLTLEGLSVGSSRILFNGPSFLSFANGNAGNIIIDSGTTLTLLPDDFFSDFVTEMTDAIPATPVDDPQQFFQLCYGASDFERINVPTVTAHFTDADVELKPLNTFVAVDQETVCLAMASSSETGLAIFGNIAQMNVLVGYDNQAMTVSFKAVDCSKMG